MKPEIAAQAWEEVLASLCRLQQGFHVLTDLRARFDTVLSELEAVAGWETARVSRPNLILGSLDGIETGVRQLRRSKPLETTTLRIGEFDVRLPTLPETLRIKAFLCLDRNATRDYLDFSALATSLGDPAAGEALESMDELYPQNNGDTWAVRTQLIKQLSDPRPYDLDRVELAEYKGVRPPFDRWEYVAQTCARLSDHLAQRFCGALCSDPHAAAARNDLAEWRAARARGATPPPSKLPGLKS